MKKLSCKILIKIELLCLLFSKIFENLSNYFNRLANKLQPKLCLETEECLNDSLGAYYQGKGKKFVEMAIAPGRTRISVIVGEFPVSEAVEMAIAPGRTRIIHDAAKLESLLYEDFKKLNNIK